MRIAGLVADGIGGKYGDWRHVATGCNAVVHINVPIALPWTALAQCTNPVLKLASSSLLLGENVEE